jgi:DNA-directed RNA polymerase specialized sigma24 family protein
MPDSHDFPPAHGDEAELFRQFHATLMRSVARAVGTSTSEVVEDACAFAWAAFLEHQPARDRNWRGWLYRTAERQAWKGAVDSSDGVA